MTWILLPLFFVLSASANLPVLALTEKGDVISGEIDESAYVETLRSLKKAVDENVATGVFARDPDAGWQLSKFTVGFGVTGEIGVGPFKYSSTIKQRFVYTRDK